jgi:cytochrome c biogenesis protein CcdA
MLAAVNPCGFALLPAHLFLLVLGEDRPSRSAAVGRALVLTAAMTLGFVAVFGIFGLVITPIAASVQRYLPWVTVVLGCALVSGGVWLLAADRCPSSAGALGDPRSAATWSAWWVSVPPTPWRP